MGGKCGALPAVACPSCAGVSIRRQKFLQTLGPRLGATLGIVTTITVLSGALLYARFFAGGISFIWMTGAGFDAISLFWSFVGGIVMGLALGSFASTMPVAWSHHC